jgi:hypothetical protein
MRWLINYIRQCFCKHDWSIEQGTVTDDWGGRWTKVYMRCKNCGYHQKHNKFI